MRSLLDNKDIVYILTMTLSLFPVYKIVEKKILSRTKFCRTKVHRTVCRYTRDGKLETRAGS